MASSAKRERQRAAAGSRRGAVARVAEKNAAVRASTAPAWANSSRNPKQARADQNPGIIIQEKGGAANFDADGEDFFCETGGKNGLARAQVWQGRAAALANEVEGKNVLAQPELFADVAGEAGTQLACAGADEHGVYLIRPAVRIIQRTSCGFGGERQRVRGEAVLQLVGRLFKNLGERFQGKVSRINVVVAAENFFRMAFERGLSCGNCGQHCNASQDSRCV